MTAPPIGLCPLRLSKRAILDGYFLSPETHLDDSSTSFCHGYLRSAPPPQANPQE